MADYESLETVVQLRRAKMKAHQERRITKLKAGLKEMMSVTEHQKPLKKEPQWKLTEHRRTDMGMGI
jgi:hypothetical protein